MKRATESLSIDSANNELLVKPLEPSDATQLGQLLFAAYKGTIDDDGHGEQESIIEAGETLAGKYGAVIWEASLTAWNKNELVSATLTTDYEKLRPLLAFAVTKPNWQGRGLATQLIKRTVSQLYINKFEHVFLVVTDGNPAESIYLRLGFSEVQRRSG